MKTRLISAILACIMIVSLTACANEGPGKTPDESTKDTTEAQTTENVTTEETTEPAAELAFNEDLLSDIGLTYPQLVEKRGEKVDTVGGEGVDFYFENGYGAYSWGYEDLDYGRELAYGESFPIPRDENNQFIPEKIPTPKQDIPCWNISQIDAKDFFLNASFPFNISNIENIKGVEDCSYADEGLFYNYYNYCSGFSYNGLRIIIDHNDKEQLEADARITVYKPFGNN